KKPEDMKEIFRSIFERVKAMPGVIAATTTLNWPPFGGPPLEVTIPGTTHTQKWESELELCSEGYLDTVQFHIQRGRFLSEEDVNAARRVLIINEAFA